MPRKAAAVPEATKPAAAPAPAPVPAVNTAKKTRKPKAVIRKAVALWIGPSLTPKKWFENTTQAKEYLAANRPKNDSEIFLAILDQVKFTVTMTTLPVSSSPGAGG